MKPAAENTNRLMKVLNNRDLVLLDNELNEAVDHFVGAIRNFKYCNNKRASRPMN